MSRRIVLLLCPLFFAASLSLHAQSQRDEFAYQDQYPINYLTPQPWVSYLAPNPRFPITVRLSQHYGRYTGISWVGLGDGHVFNPTGEDVTFHYRCGVSFPTGVPIEFYGRWITPGRKLEIVLRKPGSDLKTRTCRISTSLVTSASTPSANHAP